MIAQPVAWQSAVPLGSVGHIMQLVPQAVASSFAAQVLPQWWYPVPHVTSQLVPSQVAAVAPVGTGQALQEAPHEFTDVLEAHTFEQLCVPLGHCPLHAADEAMQTLLQSFWLVGHEPPHPVAVQVAVPPVGTGQAVQDIPQVAGSVELTQWPSQTW
jgi:hypothetical protein